MRTIDFDLYRAEKDDEPVDFIIGGKHYALPSSLPASIAVDAIRMQAMQEDEDAEVPPEMMDQFGQSIFGPTIWKELLMEHRLTVDEIEPLVERVMGAYTDAPKEETEVPTSESPEPASA